MLSVQSAVPVSATVPVGAGALDAPPARLPRPRFRDRTLIRAVRGRLPDDTAADARGAV